MRHLDAEPAGELVAHAGEAVLEVVAAGRAGAPELVQFARQAARGADDDRVARRMPVDRAQHLGVRGPLGIGRRGDAIHRLAPLGSQRFDPRLPRGGRGLAAERLTQRLERALRVADQRDRTVLAGVERRDVELDQPGVARHQRARAGGEVLQPGSDGEDQIGLGGKRVGGATSR